METPLLRSGFEFPSLVDPDDADAAVPLSEVLAQITRSKNRLASDREGPLTPSWDRDLRGKPEPGSPERIAQQQAGLPRQGPPPPPVRYNLRVDGVRPWLPGHYSGGKEFQPVPGYLPQKGLTVWDQERAMLPKRSWTTGRPADERQKEKVRAAELYDTRRAEAPDWKPTTWKHTGDCFPLDDLPALPRRGGSRYGSQAGTPKAARMQRQAGSQSLPSLPAAQTRSHGYPGPHQSLSPKHARGGFLPQVGPNSGTTPTQIIRPRGYADLR
jgi:hypothetical protein